MDHTTETEPGPADGPAVARWIARQARPLAAVAPQAPPTDLDPLRGMLARATVVGLGRPTHGASELSTLSHRMVRLLVERLGFRTLAVELDWTTGVRIDAYLRTGEGDPRALLHDAWPHYRNQETLDVLAWIRARNARHPKDPVRFVGLDVSGVRAPAHDAVAGYVRRVAPGRVGELTALYRALRPGDDIEEHIRRYRERPDRPSLLARARRARDLVAELPAGEGHALALRHADAVVGFHEAHADDDRVAHVERHMARTLLWWHEHTGHRIVHWGGFTHTAVGEARRVSFPPAPPRTHRNAGSRLRERFGDGYVSVGLTFHHGAVHPGGAAPRPVPAPAPALADAVLGGSGPERYLLDLRSGEPPAPVRAWLDAPAELRLIGPGPGGEGRLSGGSLAAWFDVLVHVRRVSPVHGLPAVPAGRTQGV